MKRTRKWQFVEQEAGRLAAMKLSPLEIAKRLGVNKSTVTRWLKSGKLTRDGDRPRRATTKLRVRADQTPREWANAVRRAYSLDPTDSQLVTLAEAMLLEANDAGVSPGVRQTAVTKFQSIVRQLGLGSRNVQEETDEDDKLEPKSAAVPPPSARPARVGGVDPRTLFLAKKSS